MMEIDDDDILRAVAESGSMDLSVWPALLPRMVSRIEKAVREDFPIPQLPVTVIPSSIPPPVPAAATAIASTTETTTAAASSSDAEETENFLPPIPSSPIEPDSTSSSQGTNKENTPITTRAPPPASSAPTATTATTAPPLEPGALPPQITAMLNEITGTLTRTFPTYPPHTIQRLAELVLTPKRHYKSLPTYLHALDRVLHVTSGLNVYPLPPAIPDTSTVTLLSNGGPDTVTPSPWAAPGSDEALGGALLTPIPWLQNQQSSSQQGSPQSHAESSSSAASGAGSAERANGSELEGEVRTESTETIDGPNGMGHIETVTVTVNGVPSMGARGVGVTQGELLRQEQRAGIVPVSQLNSMYHAQRSAPVQGQAENPRPSADAVAAAEGGPISEDVAPVPEEEKPHARGPEEIGPEDMGPQRESSSSANFAGGPGVEMQGIDVEAAVGRKATESRSSPEEAKPEQQQQEELTTAGSSSKEDTDKMDGVEPTAPQATEQPRSTTPKREAEDGLEGVNKKLKDSPTSSEPGPSDVKVEGEKTDQSADDAAETTAKEKEEQDKSKPGT